MKRLVLSLLGVALLMGTLLGVGVPGIIQPKTVSAALVACPTGTQLLYSVDTDLTITSPAVDVHCYHEIRVYASQYGTIDETIVFTVFLRPVPEAKDPPAAFPQLDQFALDFHANANVSKTYSTPGTLLSIILARGWGPYTGVRLFLKVYGNNSPAA